MLEIGWGAGFRAGKLWKTDRIIFNPHAATGPLFTVYRPGPDSLNTRARSLYKDHAGNVWCGTWNNLFRVEMVGGKARFHLVDLGTPPDKGTVSATLPKTGREIYGWGLTAACTACMNFLPAACW